MTWEQPPVNEASVSDLFMNLLMRLYEQHELDYENEFYLRADTRFRPADEIGSDFWDIEISFKRKGRAPSKPIPKTSLSMAHSFTIKEI